MGAALVVALHGSPDPGAAAVAVGLREAVASWLPGVEVRTAWVDSRLRTLDAVAEPGGVVVPAFLTAGYHVAADVPAASNGARVTGHVGPAVWTAVADRIREAGGPGEAVLLAAAGSRRSSARAEVERAAARLSGVLGAPVRVGYLYGGGGPAVEEAAEALAAEGFRDVTVGAFFVAPGRYGDRLAALGAARVAAPIGVHPALVAAIVARYEGAEAGGDDPVVPAGPRRPGGPIRGVRTDVVSTSSYLAGLRLAGRKVLVAGAGAVAARRLPALLEAGADVLVVAPEASPLVADWARVGRVSWAQRAVTADDADDAWFVLAATSNPEANALVARAAEARHTFCVRADRVDAGTARTPATGRSGAVTIGVLSMTGRDPRLVAGARDVAVGAVEAWASGPRAPRGAA